MLRRIMAMIVALALPSAAVGGPLRDAAERAADRAAEAQQVPASGDSRGGGRWKGIALIGAGGLMATLGTVELGDDETGPDDGEDADNSDDGEDADGWGDKALIGGGAALAVLGTVVLLKARKSGPVVSVGPRHVAVRHTIRF